MILKTEKVIKEWTDYNGHLNVAFYVHVFDIAADIMLDNFKMGGNSAKQDKKTTFVAEMYTAYKQEVRLGEEVETHLSYVDHDKKRIHYRLSMFHKEKKYLAATNEVLSLYVDLNKRKVIEFDNDRLKIDHMVARIVFRYVSANGGLLGGSSDDELEDMYQDETINDDLLDDVKSKVTAHFDFLRQMADYRKKKFNKGLSQHDFKVLSYLYFYIMDNYGSVNFEDTELFYENFAKANGILLNKNGKYEEEPHIPSGYMVPMMYSKYIGAPGHSGKIKMAMTYLIKEMDDLENFLEIRDAKREFTRLEKEARLAEQGFICAVDGLPLTWSEAHAAHVVSWKKGGKTVYSNLVMVRAKYNIEMGTMDFNDYMNIKKSAA